MSINRIPLLLLGVLATWQASAQNVILNSGFQACDGYEAPFNAVLWDGGGDGTKWSDPLNWEGDQVPGANASVGLRSDTGVAVVYDSSAGDTVVNQLVSCLPLQVVSGSLTMNGQSRVTEKVVISGSGTLRANSTTNLRFVEMNGGNLRGIGFVFVSRQFTWTGGTMWDAGTTVINGGLDLTTNIHYLRDGRTLELNSPTTWTGGALYTYFGGTINNNDVFDIKGDFGVLNTGSPLGSFNNANGATLQKTAGAGLANFTVNYSNDGDVVIDTGSMRLGIATLGSAMAGDFTVASGSTLEIQGNYSHSGDFTGEGGLTMLSGNGTMVLSGDYGLTGPLRVQGGTLAFQGNANAIDGDVTLVSSGVLTTSINLAIAGTVNHSNSASVRGTGTITVAGKYTWAGGSMWDSGTTVINGGLDVTTTTHYVRSGRTLELNSPTTWTGGALYTYFGGTIDNNDVFDIKGDFGVLNSGSPLGSFNNANGATLQKTAGTGLANFTANYSNDGDVIVNSGSMRLGVTNLGGTITGDFAVAGGSILEIVGNYSYSGAFTGAGGLTMITGNGTSTITGNYGLTGPLRTQGGKLVFDTALDQQDNVTVTGGTLEILGTSAIDGNLSLSGNGTFTANTDLAISGTVNHANGASLRGTGTVTVAGKYTWAGGSMWDSGTTVINGGLDVTTTTHYVRSGRTLELNSPTTWTGGVLYTYFGGTIDNNDVFDIKGDFGVLNSGSPLGLFTNATGATLQKTGGTGLANFTANFSNEGDVLVNSGSMRLGISSLGSAMAGDFTVPGGSTLEIQGNYSYSGNFTGAGNLTMLTSTGTSTISGNYGLTGTLRVQGGTLALTGSATSINGNLELVSNGNLTTDVNLSITGTVNHANTASLKGAGTVTVAGKYTWAGGSMWDSGTTVINGGLDVTTTTHYVRSGRTLELNSPTTWTSGLLYTYFGGTIDNNDVFDIKGDFGVLNSGSPAGAFNNASGATLQKTGGAGQSSFSTAVNNAGAITIDTGSLRMTAPFTQASTGTLFVDIESNSVFDTLVVTSTAALDGTLDIDLAGGYTPANGLVFQILTGSTVSGTFNAVNDAAIGNGDVFDVVYTGTDVSLEVVTP